MTYRFMNKVMTETSLYTEQIEEMNDGDFEKIVNSYKEKLKVMMITR